MTELPAEIGELRSLRDLQISENRINRFPSTFTELKELSDLDCSFNELTELPSDIGRLVAIHSISASHNRLSQIPSGIDKLTELEFLDVSHNRLESIPDEIGGVSSLTRLIVSDNSLKIIPSTLRRLQKLKELYLHNNESLGLPPEVLGEPWHRVSTEQAKPTSPRTILAFYFRALSESSRVSPAGHKKRRPRTLNEAKILVVGEPGVGKTALIHWLLNGRRKSNPEWTKGIKIAEWQIPVTSADDPPIRVNVWDFGGQEIMQATHQFFLTERSLYLLVLDSRENEEQSRLRYWLEKIRTFGGDSPVVVVLNKRDEGSFEPDESRLRKDYPKNLLDSFFRTVCDAKQDRKRNGEGVADLRNQIYDRVRQLENVQQVVPESYLRAKNTLEAQAQERKNLSRSDYDVLCKKHGLTADDRAALLSYLKELGTLFHYRSPSGFGPLPDTFVLDPTWVTKGVYAILTDQELRDRGGELLPSDLTRIFRGKRDYPRQHQQFILAMMEAELFELCFPISDPLPGKAGLRLIPELLPPREPDHGIEPGSSLNLEYRYPYLPAGVIPRFIVRMHNAVSRHTYWKNGVVLLIDGRRVLVRGSREEKKVFVSVDGRESGSRRALMVVRQNLDAVHAAMRLEPEEMVTLPDNPNVTVSYRDLEQYEREEGPHYEWRPQGGVRKYTVRELLDGIEEPVLRLSSFKKEEEKLMTDTNSKVFLSYAWEDDDFAARVKKLADNLREQGVNAWIDQYEGEMGPSIGWPSWMDKMIREASVVLLVCSPKYLRRVKKEEAPGAGLGATWEAHIIYQHLYEAGAVSEKFRAVALDELHLESIPTPVASYTNFRLYNTDGYERLYRALTGQPRVVAPPLGAPRKLASS